jgi:uridylate kinase
MGNPYFSTDTAAALRAAEIDAEAILMAKNVDGIYNCDPSKNPDAVKYDRISYQEYMNEGLGAIDLTAASFCKDNAIPTLVFGLNDPDNIIRAVKGESIGTIIY